MALTNEINISTTSVIMGYSNETSDQDIDSAQEALFPRAFLYLNAVMRGTMGMLAIVTNLVIILAIALTPMLHTFTNYLIATLGAADMVGGFSSLCHVALYLIPLSDYLWQRLCAIDMSVNLTSAGANVLTLCMISIDRFIYITKPLRYHALMTQKVFHGFVLFLLAVLGSVMIYGHSGPYGRISDLCTADIFIRSLGFLNSLFYGFMLVTILMYSGISVVAFKQRRAISAEQCSVDTQTMKKEHKILKMLVLVLGVYIMCYVPQTILNLSVSKSQRDRTHFIMDRIFSWFWWVNAFANPIIYVWKNRDIRKAVWALLRLRDNSEHAMQNTVNTGQNQL